MVKNLSGKELKHGTQKIGPKTAVIPIPKLFSPIFTLDASRNYLSGFLVHARFVKTNIITNTQTCEHFLFSLSVEF